MEAGAPDGAQGDGSGLDADASRPPSPDAGGADGGGADADAGNIVEAGADADAGPPTCFTLSALGLTDVWYSTCGTGLACKSFHLTASGSTPLLVGDDPTVSPDLNNVLYISGSSPGGGWTMNQLNLLTSADAVICQHNDGHCFTNDGLTLIFNQGTGIYQQSIDGGGYGAITMSPGGYDGSPQINRVNGTIALHNSNSGIVTCARNGASRTNVPNTVKGDYTPSWSPDGMWIAFTRGVLTGPGEIWKIHPSGGQLTQLTNFAGSPSVSLKLANPSVFSYAVTNAWTPDGGHVLVGAVLTLPNNNLQNAIIAVATDGSFSYLPLCGVNPANGVDFVYTITGLSADGG
jgi:Tol biopolymer transport system component